MSESKVMLTSRLAAQLATDERRVLAVDWGVRGAWEPTVETRHYFFLVRLVAFVLLVLGIIDKNRTRPSD